MPTDAATPDLPWQRSGRSSHAWSCSADARPLDPLAGTGTAVFDDDTDRAVRAFQQQRGLTVDGVVGGTTYHALDEARWRLGDRILSYVPARLLAGDDVSALQQRLLDMGFDCGRVDGLFGVETEQALREFQRNIGIPADGTCGPATLKALNQLARTVVGGQPQAMRETEAINRAGPTLSGKLVIIDPGHGGQDSGVGGHQLGEAVLVYDLASRVEGRLTATGSSAFLTRGPDGDLDEVDRASFANAAGADLVISLHVDAHSSRIAAGCSTYYFGNDRIGHHSVVGERFADLVQREVCARTDLRRPPDPPQDLGPASAHPDARGAHRARLPHQPLRCGAPVRPRLP